MADDTRLKLQDRQRGKKDGGLIARVLLTLLAVVAVVVLLAALL